MAKVKSVNTAAYEVNVMSNSLDGDLAAEPKMLLQPGHEVTTVGFPKKNKFNVSYTPVMVRGNSQDMFWVRTTSIDDLPPADTATSYTPPASVASMPVSQTNQASQYPFFVPQAQGIPDWVMVVGAGVFALLGLALIKSSAPSSSHNRGRA